MILRTYCCSNKLKMRLHHDLNIQNDETENKAATEEQKKVSSSSYYYIILQTCCSNTLKTLLHINLKIQDDEETNHESEIGGEYNQNQTHIRCGNGRCNDLSFIPSIHCNSCNKPCHTYCYNYQEKKCKQCVEDAPIKEPGNEIEPSSSQTSPRQPCKFKEQLIQKSKSKGKNQKGNKGGLKKK
jgi:hypothetical protein